MGTLLTAGADSYVLTCAHVCRGLRSVRQVIDQKTGSIRQVVEFGDATVLKIENQDGRMVGQSEHFAEVVRYSDAEHGHDLALLKIRKKLAFQDRAVFYIDTKPISVGTPVWHVGSLLGQRGANSVTTGIISQDGRLIGNRVYTQSTATAFPGSSGGGMFLNDGRQIGILVRGFSETFTFFVPARRILEWANKNGIMFLLDNALPAPTDAELRKWPIEDVGITFTGNAGLEKAPTPKPTEFDIFKEFIYINKGSK
jgi:S1-C subfamily serine protease